MTARREECAARICKYREGGPVISSDSIYAEVYRSAKNIAPGRTIVDDRKSTIACLTITRVDSYIIIITDYFVCLTFIHCIRVFIILDTRFNFVKMKVCFVG